MANAVIEGRQGEAMEEVSEEMPAENAEAPESIEEVVAEEETTTEE